MQTTPLTPDEQDHALGLLINIATRYKRTEARLKAALGLQTTRAEAAEARLMRLETYAHDLLATHFAEAGDDAADGGQTTIAGTQIGPDTWSLPKAVAADGQAGLTFAEAMAGRVPPPPMPPGYVDPTPAVMAEVVQDLPSNSVVDAGIVAMIAESKGAPPLSPQVGPVVLPPGLVVTLTAVSQGDLPATSGKPLGLTTSVVGPPRPEQADASPAQIARGDPAGTPGAADVAQIDAGTVNRWETAPKPLNMVVGS